MSSIKSDLNQLKKVEGAFVLCVWISTLICARELISSKSYIWLLTVILISFSFLAYEFLGKRNFKKSIFIGILVVVFNFSSVAISSEKQVLISKLQGEWLSIDEEDTLKIIVLNDQFVVKDLTNSETLGEYRIEQLSLQKLLLFDDVIEIELEIKEKGKNSFELESEEFLFNLYR